MNMTQRTKTTHYELSLLNNRNISNEHMITLRNKFDALQEISKTFTPNEKHENFINTHIEAVVECIQTKLSAKHRVPWETLAVRKNETTGKQHPYVIK